MAFEVHMAACAAEDERRQHTAHGAERQAAADESASHAARTAIRAIPAWAFTAGVLADIAACLESRCRDLGAEAGDIASGYLVDLHDDMKACA